MAIHPNTKLDVSFHQFDRVFSYSTFGSSEALIQLLNRTVNIAEVPEVPQKLKERYFRLAQQNIGRQTTNFPQDARMIFVIGSFYSNLGVYEEALKYLKRARELTPTRQDVYIELGTAYFALGEIENAVKNFEFAIELEPRNSEGFVRYALTYLYSNNPEEAEPILKKIDSGVFYSNDRILKAFAVAGQYDRVLDIWQTRVEREPDNVEYRKSLAATFLKLGEWDEAIAQIEKIMEIEPSFKEAGNHAISEIRAGRGDALVDK
jgi:tetratricopeptide (TPR) repeat protein